MAAGPRGLSYTRERTRCSDHSQPGEIAELQMLEFLQAFDCDFKKKIVSTVCTLMPCLP